MKMAFTNLETQASFVVSGKTETKITRVGEEKAALKGWPASEVFAEVLDGPDEEEE